MASKDAVERKVTNSLSLIELRIRSEAEAEARQIVSAEVEAEQASGAQVSWKEHNDRVNTLTNELIESRSDALNVSLSKYGAYSGVYELSDRILTNQDVNVHVIKDATSKDFPCPAANDGKNIVFNFAHITEDESVNSDDFLLSLHGLNHHEVAHILWTPREQSDLVKWVVANGHLQAFNHLEDNRIENLMVAKYPSVAAFFIQSATQQIINTPENKDYQAGLYPLVCSRAYLPQELVSGLAQLFTAEHGLDMTHLVKSIADEYAKLAFPSGFSRAKELIEKWSLLFDLQMLTPPPTQWGLATPWDSGTQSDSAPSEAQQQGQQQQQQGMSVSNSACTHRQPMSGGRAESNKNQTELQDKWQPQDLTNATPRDSDSEQQANNNTDSNSDSAGTNGNGAGGSIKEIAKQLNKKSKQQAQQELDATRKVLKNKLKTISTLPKAQYKETPVSTHMRTLANAVSSEFARAEIDADPYWERELPSGKLNIQRALHADVNEINTLFDRWAIGDTSTEIECVLLLDTSGSMSRSIVSVMQSAWIIKRALENIQAHVSINTFSTESKRLYDRDEKARPDVYRYRNVSQTTNPTDALIDTVRLMENATAPNKIVILLTDGCFDYAEQPDALIEQLKESGVTVVVVFLGDARYVAQDDGKWVVKHYTSADKEVSHNADVFAHIESPDGLVKVAREVVTSTLRKVAASVR